MQKECRNIPLVIACVKDKSSLSLFSRHLEGFIEGMIREDDFQVGVSTISGSRIVFTRLEDSVCTQNDTLIPTP